MFRSEMKRKLQGADLFEASEAFRNSSSPKAFNRTSDRQSSARFRTTRVQTPLPEGYMTMWMSLCHQRLRNSALNPKPLDPKR